MVGQMIKTLYKARVRKSGDYWAIFVPEISGLFSQALSRNTVEEMTREAIAFWFDNTQVHLQVLLQQVLRKILLSFLLCQMVNQNKSILC